MVGEVAAMRGAGLVGSAAWLAGLLAGLLAALLAGCVEGGDGMADVGPGADAAVDADPLGPSDGGSPERGAPDAAGAAQDAGADGFAVDAGPPVDAAPAGDAGPQTDAGAEERCIGPETGDAVEWVIGDIRATVSAAGERCARTFTLSTTAVLRDGRPDNPRIIRERADRTTVRTGDALFDGLYALAVEEAGQNAVDAIRDGSFRDGEPVPCPPDAAGGCFETGRAWNYVWTRDTAYAVDLGLGLFDPTRALNSLMFKLSRPRDGGRLRVVQDTGTGGSWPVSTDRVTWALGARALAPLLDPEPAHDLRRAAIEALAATAWDDDEAAFDAVIGLYLGEQSFLDWREQSYPDWVAGRPAHIAMSATLGTNVAHYAARRWLARLEQWADRPEQAALWDAAADRLRTAIRERLFDPPSGLPSAFLTTTLDRAPTRQHDLLGTTLAILEGVLDADEGRAALSAWPLLPGGPPVIWPQQQFTPIYHNRGQWPFVTAYFARAGARVRHAKAVEAGIETLMRGAAANLSNMENFEAASGLAWVDDGPYSGPVVNSQRQLWSVAGYLGVVHEVVFGLRFEDERLRFVPGLTRRLRARWFEGAPSLTLEGVRWRRRVFDVRLVLPPAADDGAPDADQGYRVVSLRVGGRPIDPAVGLAPADLDDGRLTVEVQLAPDPWPAVSLTRIEDPGRWRAVFAPRSPIIERLSWTPDGVSLDVRARDDDVRIELLRDGQLIVGDLDAGFIDHDVEAGDQACYTARAVFRDTGLTSQHAEPQCWWGRDGARVSVYEAEALEVVEGERADEHGRPHVRDPGGGGVAVARFVPRHEGLHGIQVVYGNGVGPVETGVTCAVRTVDVIALDNEELIGTGTIVLPHLGAWDRWADSSIAFVDLWAARPYRIHVHGSRVGNMSRLAHFEGYTGGAGGVHGPVDAANIAAVKVLAFDRIAEPPMHMGGP